MADWSILPYPPIVWLYRIIPAFISPVFDKYSAEFKNWEEVHPCSGIHLYNMNKKNLTFVV
jgi:hypothetical protein